MTEQDISRYAAGADAAFARIAEVIESDEIALVKKIKVSRYLNFIRRMSFEVPGVREYLLQDQNNVSATDTANAFLRSPDLGVEPIETMLQELGI